MKARYGTFAVSDIQKQIDAAVQEELSKLTDEVYAKVEWDCFCQSLACCFAALELMGWRKKRLTEFKNKVDDVTHMMFTGVLGREYTTRDALLHLKEAYGIDLTESQYKEEYEEDARRNER